MIKIRKLATYFIIGTLTLTGKTAFASAEEPIAGIGLVLEDLYLSTEDAHEEITQYLLSETASEYDNLAFAQVTNYVNIRSKAGEDSEILGKLYNNSAATIISNEDDWYHIKSGSVAGYIKSEFLLTGTRAAELAESVGNRLATVTTTTLKVREKASIDAAVLTLVPMGDELMVAKEQEDWVKVILGDNEYGYVSADYVKVHTVYEEAVSIEEEQERLMEEAAANSASESNSSGNTTSNTTSNTATTSQKSFSTSTVSSSDSSSLGAQIASYAIQYEGNPYVWGGTSLTNGTDCSGFTQSVFAHFGISIPRTSRTQASGGRRVSLDNLHKGDLVFYARNGSINHVAIYIGNGKVISASSPETGIRITSYNYRTPYKAVSYIN
jgi:cell wall-associated NlpC family hydrolase